MRCLDRIKNSLGLKGGKEKKMNRIDTEYRKRIKHTLICGRYNISSKGKNERL